VGAFLEAILFVVPTILFCACQAYAYRAIELQPSILSEQGR